MEWIICMAVGGCAGIIGSMLGTGSGFVLIPGLALALTYAGIGGNDTLKIAIATTHAANIFTALSILQAHAARDNIDWDGFARITPGIMIGSVLGGTLAGIIDVAVMTVIFAGFAMFMAWRMIRGRVKPDHPVAPLPGALNLSCKGFGIGALAALAGSGGLTTPLLSSYMSMRRAIGTSAAITLPITVPAALTLALMDAPSECGRNCLGLIYIPAVCAAGITAVLAAPLGAWLAHMLPVMALRRIFAGLLICVAANLILNAIPDMKQMQASVERFSVGLFPAANAGLVEASQAPAWLQTRP